MSKDENLEFLRKGGGPVGRIAGRTGKGDWNPPRDEKPAPNLEAEAKHEGHKLGGRD